MKKFIILSMLLIFSATTFSQQNRSYTKYSYLDYQLKSKHQKTAAWILLGGGLGLTVTGGVIAVNQFAEDFTTALFTGKSRIRPSGFIMFAGGSVAMLSSIPLFIYARKNKKRSMVASAGFKMEKTALQKYSLIHSSFPAISVKINPR